MSGQPRAALTVGGVPLYQKAGGILDGLDVIRPEYGGAGLLDDGARFANLRRNFAGGLLNGFQYNPNAALGETMLRPIAPSGVYTADPSQATVVTEADPGRRLTYRDALTLMYGPLIGRDVTEMSGGPQAQAQLLNHVLDGGRSGVDLEAAYDPSAEPWKKLVNRLGAAGNARSGGGDGGQ